MVKEFNLSKEIRELKENYIKRTKSNYYPWEFDEIQNSVKEFSKKLKEFVEELQKEIDKLAGKDLI